MSVFAIARAPLLVYLGARLYDGIPADIYQRQRSIGDWQWTDPNASTTFVIAGPAGDDGGAEAVLITNMSGTTPVNDLPVELQGAPTWTITPDTGPAEDVFASAEVLARFVETVRALFTGLEATHKYVERVHLFGALPVAGAIEFGRILKSDGLRPTVVTHDREDGGYQKALEV